ncbi:DNA repair protein rad16 [Ophidiomyces ophidiicola]|uniref:DNA repair protein rad16 n=1 Tax=Ophidiomyces ophidiicola TaxID=1387563 RepID=UPI0020C46DB9|nr:DNA repair protein rad16 [Ophidiomyces ophidiicola]KAI1935071.1 DNA repair protein rad16 [Ophidiomyces ophidiicola]KAI2042290.1 DNA repair protein rad16 [Ophidiomyces ophidiicola]
MVKTSADEHLQELACISIDPIIELNINSDDENEDVDSSYIIDTEFVSETLDLSFSSFDSHFRASLIAELILTAEDHSFPEIDQFITDVQKIISITAQNNSAHSEKITGIDSGMTPNQDFLSLQIQLNSVGMVVPNYTISCAILGLDPNMSLVADVTLELWQVTGIIWMLEQKSSQIEDDILENESDMNKTIESLDLISLTTKLFSDPYKPILIMAPSQPIDTWMNELKKYFNGDLYLILHYDINGLSGTSDSY